MFSRYVELKESNATCWVNADQVTKIIEYGQGTGQCILHHVGGERTTIMQPGSEVVRRLSGQ